MLRKLFNKEAWRTDVGTMNQILKFWDHNGLNQMTKDDWDQLRLEETLSYAMNEFCKQFMNFRFSLPGFTQTQKKRDFEVCTKSLPFYSYYLNTGKSTMLDFKEAEKVFINNPPSLLALLGAVCLTEGTQLDVDIVLKHCYRDKIPGYIWGCNQQGDPNRACTLAKQSIIDLKICLWANIY